jgi:hypothetical protein
MKNIPRILSRIAILLPLLAGCSSAPKINSQKINSMKPDAPADHQARRNLLIGNWYGEAATKDGQFRKALMNRRADGTYTVKFQLFKNQTKTIEQVEAGLWGISGNIYFTITREMLEGETFTPVQTDDATYYDAYKIAELTPEAFRYTNQDTGDEFLAKKVSDEFKLK